jgi:hypothetical protein
MNEHEEKTDDLCKKHRSSSHHDDDHYKILEMKQMRTSWQQTSLLLPYVLKIEYEFKDEIIYPLTRY